MIHKMDVIVENVKKEEITSEDFPRICRICLLQGDLKPFEGEDCLLDLFMSITQIDVHSMIDFPRNICNSCVNKLEDISLSIDIWKNNSRMKEEKEAIEDIKGDMMPVCIICSSRSDLMSFEVNAELSQLFRNITNIEVKDEMDSATGNGMCSECLDKLEDISSFIRFSLCNDEKLEYAVGRKIYVKCETYSDGIGINSSSSDGLKSEVVADNNEAMKENPIKKTISDEFEEKQKNTGMEGHIFETELSNSLTRTYRTELATRSQKSTQKLFPTQDSLYLTIEEFPQCDLSNEDSTYTSYSRQQMLQKTKKKFKCDICSKEFTRKNSLQSHSLICLGEKPFECDYCEKSFDRRGNLEIHFRTHTGEKPFKCDCCEKSFNQKGDLKRHLRTHTGEKPYECDYCEKSFIRKWNLKRHLQSHSGEKSSIIRPFAH